MPKQTSSKKLNRSGVDLGDDSDVEDLGKVVPGKVVDKAAHDKFMRSAGYTPVKSAPFVPGHCFFDALRHAQLDGEPKGWHRYKLLGLADARRQAALVQREAAYLHGGSFHIYAIMMAGAAGSVGGPTQAELRRAPGMKQYARPTAANSSMYFTAQGRFISAFVFQFVVITSSAAPIASHQQGEFSRRGIAN